MEGLRKTEVAMIIITGAILVYAIVSDYYLKQDLASFHAEQLERLESVKMVHDSQITTLNQMVNTVKAESEKKIGEVNKLIKKTQKESESQISELQEELKGISVEAGDFSAVIEEVLPGVVSIITDRGQGSGVIVTSDGYIVTNYHVMKGATQLTIITYDNKLHAGALVGKQELNDIAILKMNVQEEVTDLNFANSDNVKIGEKVAALGNPVGLGFSVTQGIISQKDRVLRQGTIGLLQTDVAINPGNSGGPLINTQGKVIGILRLKIAEAEQLGFAIPSNYVVEIAEQITGLDI